ncbi:MAG: hypothetical protein AAF747_01330 [Planctomycetota bacterium]
MQRRMPFSSAIAVAGIAAAAGYAAAQADRVELKLDGETTSQSSNLPAGADRPLNTLLEGRASFAFDADLDGTAGSVSVDRYASALTLIIRVGERARLIVRPEYEYSNYDFDDVENIAPTPGSGPTDDPFDDGEIFGFTGRFIQPLDGGWTVIVGGGARWGYEDGADLDNAAVGNGFGGVDYKVSDKFKLGVFGFVSSQLEDEPLFFVAPSFDWRINDKLRFRSQGPGLELSWRPRDEFDAIFELRWENREFRLRDDGPIPEGVMQDQRLAVGVTGKWRPHPFIELQGSVGGYLWGEIEFLDRDGIELTDAQLNPHLYLGAGVTLRF